MQIQIKKQLKIELDQADIVEAIGDYLIKHGQKVNAEALAEMTFVKSPKDGLRASLNLTEESGTEAEPQLPNKDCADAETQAATVEDIQAQEEPIEQPVEEVVIEEGPTEQGPVEDVMPSLDEIKEVVESNQPESESTTELPVEEPAVEERKSLFGSSGFL